MCADRKRGFDIGPRISGVHRVKLCHIATQKFPSLEPL